MSSENGAKIGVIAWQGLTVLNAAEVRDFYEAGVGWESQGEDMGGYEDFHMISPDTGTSAAGICHARGENANVPPHWLVYINVADVDSSALKCQGLGGGVLDGPRMMCGGRFCVIRDPAGAVCALYADPPTA